MSFRGSTLLDVEGQAAAVAPWSDPLLSTEPWDSSGLGSMGKQFCINWSSRTLLFSTSSPSLRQRHKIYYRWHLNNMCGFGKVQSLTSPWVYCRSSRRGWGWDHQSLEDTSAWSERHPAETDRQIKDTFIRLSETWRTHWPSSVHTVRQMMQCLLVVMVTREQTNLSLTNWCMYWT